MDADAKIFRLERFWNVTNVANQLHPRHPFSCLRLTMYPNRLEIRAEGKDVPLPCEWNRIAQDIGDCLNMNNNDFQDTIILIKRCSFPAAIPFCPGWHALLEQLNLIISVHSSSLRVTFDDCAFAGGKVRQSIGQALRRMNAGHVDFTSCSLTLPAFVGSDRMTHTLYQTHFSGKSGEQDKETTVYDNWGSFYLIVRNNDHAYENPSDLRVEWSLHYAQPTGHQWQMIATITGNSTANEGIPIGICFSRVVFRNSAGLGAFLEAVFGMSVGPTIITKGRRVEVTLAGCTFPDMKALHSIGTALASNKAVKCVRLPAIAERPLCDVVDLLSQLATLTEIEFEIPRNSKHQHCICKSLAASTGLVSVKLKQQYGRDDTDYIGFVRDVRHSVASSAFKTRGKYRDWFILPVEALPYLCEYVQFGMPRLAVTYTDTRDECKCVEEEGSTDLYRVQLLYDIIKSRSTLIHNVTRKLPNAGSASTDEDYFKLPI